MNIQKYYIAEDGMEAADQARKLMADGAPEIVLKAQILAGGRGKGTFLPSGFKGGVSYSDAYYR